MCQTVVLTVEELAELTPGALEQIAHTLELRAAFAELFADRAGGLEARRLAFDLADYWRQAEAVRVIADRAARP